MKATNQLFPLYSVFLVLFYSTSFIQYTLAQNRQIDSIKNILQISTVDTLKVSAYTRLCWEYHNSNPQLAIQYAKAGLAIAEKNDYQRGLASLFNNVAQAYFVLGDYEKTLNYSLKSLKIKETLNNKRGIAGTLNNIGLVYKQMGNFNEAYNYFTKALSINEQLNNRAWKAINLSNIGNIEKKWNNLDKALNFHFEALAIYNGMNDSMGIANCLTSIGIIYQDQNKLDDAYNNFIKAKNIYVNAKSTQRIVLIYSNLGEINIIMGDYSKAQKFLFQALDIARPFGFKDNIKLIYQNLATNYAKQNNFSKAYEYHQFYSQMKDSIFNEESSKQIAEMQSKYETEKKEQQIKLMVTEQEKERLIVASESKRQRFFLLLILAIAISVAIVAIIIFRSLRISGKQKNIIELQKNEVSLQKEIVEKQKHLVEAHQKEIIDSITSAKRIQQAILPPTELIKKIFPESFVYYKPKDIIAGDFYWIETIDNFIFIAAADCTGHGVPGALVSVVCSNALNRTVKEFGLRDTGKILDKVTDLVIETFEKSSTDVKDGMDISLLRFENLTSSSIEKISIEVQWSGANNPLWYFNGNELKKIKADKQPIGKHDNRKSFTAHPIKLFSSSDIGSSAGLFYLFTDGLPDQFGGSQGKKFMYKRFEENLSAIYKLPMNEQETILEKTFQDWKGALDQVDDVTVIGIKI